MFSFLYSIESLSGNDQTNPLTTFRWTWKLPNTIAGSMKASMVNRALVSASIFFLSISSKHLLLAFATVLANRRLFVTKDGRLGIGWEEAQAGDRICVLYTEQICCFFSAKDLITTVA